jgi:hypothetical protein
MDKRLGPSVLALAELALALTLGCSSPRPDGESPRDLRAVVMLTAQQCTAAAIDGKVGLCHATGSGSNPYVHIEVAVSACINGHAKKHPDDFISNDPNCARCGNGVVEVGETCDPPSSCPTSCDDGNVCSADQLSGSAATCTAICQHTPISVCRSGDGCCASGCNTNNDNDCPATCGNGVVEAGETCDPPSSCPTACDDGNDCTVDRLTGSAVDCSAACSFTPYTCVDGLECTSDICNGDGTCTFAINPGNCVAEGVCHAGGHGPVDPEPNPPTSNEPVAMSVTGTFMGLDVSWDGRFTIGAFHPSPWELLYGWPGSPWSTGATIRVDADAAHFGADLGDSEFLQYPYDAGSFSSVAVWRMGPVVITQTLRIVANTTTGEPDVIKTQYDFSNTDTEPHDVGLRMLLDTEINHNDGVPFRVPGLPGPITTETEFYGADIPQFFQAFLDLDDPTYVIEGTLRGGDATPPDRFAMVSWLYASNSDWEYQITPGAPFEGVSSLDSCVLLYWSPQTMQPWASRRIVSYYGLGVLTGSPTLAISGPARLRLTHNAWAPNPFTVMAYLKNTDSVSQTGEALTLSFAETGGLTLDSGETATHALPDIPAGETLSTSWRVVPLASGTWTYRVSKVSSPETWAQRSVTVPQPWACMPSR